MRKAVVLSGEEGVERSAVLLKAGGVVVYPTETLYGLGASIASASAVERVCALKRRPPAMSLSVAVPSLDAAMTMLGLTAFPPDSKGRIAPLLELPVTVLLPARQIQNPKSPIIGEGGLIGIRLVRHPLGRKLVEAAGPITATSANIHGGPDPATVEEAARQMGDGPDAYLDGGPVGGRPTTVVRFGRGPGGGLEAKIIREGAARLDDIRRVMGDG